MTDIPEIPVDGERLTTDCYGPTVSEHMHRYAIASLFTKGKDVLDIASGEGYGSHYLSTQAKSVTGVDIALDAITHAQAKYQRPNLKFIQGDCAAMPLADHSVDVVVSFETIEHITGHDAFFAEIKRVLRHDGILVISTPDRKNYSEKDNFQNPFHLRELYEDQFRSLIGKYFKKAHYGRQAHKTGSVAEFYPPSELSTMSGDFDCVAYKKLREEGIYSIAIAGDQAITKPDSSIFLFHTNTPQALSRYARCEVFVSQDGNYVSHKFESVNIQLNEETTLVFKKLKKYVSAGKVHLRIDPLDRIGTFAIVEAAVHFACTGQTTSPLQATILLDRPVSVLNCLKLDDKTECYVALDDDPQVTFAPFDWDGVTDWWLEMRIKTFSHVRDAALHNEQQIAHINELDAAIAQKEHVIAERDSNLKTLEMSREKLTEQIKVLRSELEATIAENKQQLFNICEIHAKEVAIANEQCSKLLREVEQAQRQLTGNEARYLAELAAIKAEFGSLLHNLENQLALEQSAHQEDTENFKKILDQVNKNLSSEQSAHQQTLARHDATISKIQNSLSWRIMRPFRYIGSRLEKFYLAKIHRRQLDVIRSPESVSKLLHHNLEKPENKLYQKSGNPVVVEGWCVDKVGNGVLQVRIRLGRRIIICNQMDRPDVANHFKESYTLPLATGFRAEFKTGIGLKRLRIEACLQSGRWMQLGTRLLQVGAYVPPEKALAIPGDDAAWPTEPDGTPAVAPDIKAIAFYLPQFHPIPENDLWWGDGFTEWSNVRPAKPQFDGHYQPHEPGEHLGYYDIREIETMNKQAAMARAAGIYGFCYYYYWFDGKRLLERPLEQMLQSGKPEMPFCYCWANENWSRRWDGQDAEILIAQNHSPEDDVAIIRDIARAFQDHRYIRVNKRPLLIVYRPALLPDSKATFDRWRSVCREIGVGEIHLAGVKGFGCAEPRAFGLDALIEFPPNDSGVVPRPRGLDGSAARFEGKVYDMREARANSAKIGPQGFTFYRGVTPSWDNTARRKNFSSIFVNASPGVYYNWLQQAIDFTRRYLPAGQRLLFINAWNEWAEGCHLEPDKKHGHAWLNATRKALGSYTDAPVSQAFLASQAPEKQTHEELGAPCAPARGALPQQALSKTNSESPPLPECPRIVISALFYYREDIIYDFLDKIIPQVCDLLQKHPCRCEIVLLLNYPALPETCGRIDDIVRNSPAHPHLKVTVRAPGYNSGFGAGHNKNFKEHDSDLFILINSDLRVEKHDWLSDLLARASASPRPAIIGPIASAARLREDGCGLDAPNPLVEGFDFVDGSLMAVNSAVARELGLFNESIRYFYFEDSDLCLRYRQAGYQLALMDIKTHHARSVSSLLLPRPLIKGVLDHNRGRFFDMWGGFLKNRRLPNRLAVVFTTQNPAAQMAALPALMGLLSDHPSAVLDVGGVVSILRDFFNHKRIAIRPSWEMQDSKGDYHRYYEIGRTDDTAESMMRRTASQIGTQAHVADAAAHLRSLVDDKTPAQQAAIIVCAAQPDPLTAGGRPDVATWRDLLALLSSQHGPTLKTCTDVAIYNMPADMPAHEPMTSDNVLGLVSDFSAAACVVTCEHWTLQLAQILGVKTIAWLGSTSAETSVWAWESTGVFSDTSLDCLGCRLKMGAPTGNICLRGDERCMAARHVPAFATMIVDFLKHEVTQSWHIPAWKPAVLTGAECKSEQLDLGRWRESAVSSVMIVVLGHASDTARATASQVAASIPGSKAVFCDYPANTDGQATLSKLVAPMLSDEKWVFCVDGAVMEYHAELIEKLAIHAGFGIAAPYVIMNTGDEPVNGDKARAICDQFTKGAIGEPVCDLSVVSVCFMANADIFRHAETISDNPSASLPSFPKARLDGNILTSAGSLSKLDDAGQMAFCHSIISNNLPVKLVTSLFVVASRTGK